MMSFGTWFTVVRRELLMRFDMDIAPTIVIAKTNNVEITTETPLFYELNVSCVIWPHNCVKEVSSRCCDRNSQDCLESSLQKV